MEPKADLKREYFRTQHLQANLGGRTVRGGAVTFVSQGIKFFLGIGTTVVLARLLTPRIMALSAWL